MSSVLKATIENQTTSVTAHFKKLTTGNEVVQRHTFDSEIIWKIG